MASLLACNTVFVLSTALLSDIYVNAQIITLTDLDNEFTYFFDGYFDKQSIVPLQTVGSTMAVTVDFDLVSIVDFDDNSGSATVAGYLTVTWTEERYTTVVDDIDVSVTTSAIWTPPLLIVNSMSSATSIGSDDDIAKFNLNTARVVWKPWLHTKVACDSNSFFPFDQQGCSLKISSLSLDNTEMTIAVADDTIGMTSFIENSLWKVKTTSATRYIDGSYSYVEYQITIQRKSHYLTFIIVCPMVTISLVHLFVFLIPAQRSDERSKYSIISITGVLVTLLWTLTYIPLNTTPVSIIVYYLFTEFLINVGVMIVAISLMDKFDGCKRCSNSMCFGNRVQERKPEKGLDKDGSSIRSNSIHDPTTPRDVHVASVATAWDDEVFDERPHTPEKLPDKRSDDDGKSVCLRAPVNMFLLFLCLHACFTTAFLVPLGLNIK